MKLILTFCDIIEHYDHKCFKIRAKSETLGSTMSYNNMLYISRHMYSAYEWIIHHDEKKNEFCCTWE